MLSGLRPGVEAIRALVYSCVIVSRSRAFVFGRRALSIYTRRAEIIVLESEIFCLEMMVGY